MLALFAALTTRLRPAAPVDPYEMNITDERIQEIKSILLTVGLPEEDYGIARSIKRKSSYGGGSLEWTERDAGVRFWVNGWADTGTVTGVEVVAHGYTRYTDEEIKAANLKLAALFV